MSYLIPISLLFIIIITFLICNTTTGTRNYFQNVENAPYTPCVPDKDKPNVKKCYRYQGKIPWSQCLLEKKDPYHGYYWPYNKMQEDCVGLNCDYYKQKMSNIKGGQKK